MPKVATVKATGDQDVNGLMSGVKWAVQSLTYSFPAADTNYFADYPFPTEPDNNFEALNATQQGAATAALQMISAVCGLTFTQVAETDTKHGDIRFGMTDETDSAWAYYPATGGWGGDVWFNNSSGAYDNPVKGNHGWHSFIHELGHGLGLKHGHEPGGGFPAMTVAHDTMEYSIMSYRSYVGDVNAFYPNEEGGYAQTLMMYDIAALQHMYGANYNSNSGNTVYTWDETTGEHSINGVGQGVPFSNRVFSTVWDGNGIDTYDLSNYATNLTLDLRPGEWSTFDPAQLALLESGGSEVARGNVANAMLFKGDLRSIIENANGGSGSDTITGNQVANVLAGNAGDDTLSGEAGNDTLNGGIGSDTMNGGLGADRFLYLSILDSPFGAGDLINGFSWIEADRVDLSALDIDAVTPDVQHFFFIGGAAFSNTPGELAFNGGALNGDADGDGAADFEITLAGVAAFAATDLIFGLNLLGTKKADVLNGGSGLDTINGGSGHDLITGAGAADSLIGGAGNDTLRAGVGADVLLGDAGNDLLEGEDGNDTARGGAGNDILRGGIGQDLLNGEAGNDRLEGGDGVDTLNGGVGNDTMFGDDGEDVLNGEVGNDVLNGGLGGDSMLGGAGNDAGFGGDGDDTISGGDGNDTLRGEAGADSISGDAGNDTLYGEAENDTLTGGAGNDTLQGGDGDDELSGDLGNDKLYGNANDDVLNGGDGNDSLEGGDGDDALLGGNGNDSLTGGAGSDTVTGGLGKDTYVGGIDADVFVFISVADSPRGSNRDIVKDYVKAEGDMFDVSAIDADGDAGNGDTAFTFIGADPFSNVAGQLRFAGGLLQGDTNGDGLANLEVSVTAAVAPIDTDFFL